MPLVLDRIDSLGSPDYNPDDSTPKLRNESSLESPDVPRPSPFNTPSSHVPPKIPLKIDLNTPTPPPVPERPISSDSNLSKPQSAVSLPKEALKTDQKPATTPLKVSQEEIKLNLGNKVAASMGRNFQPPIPSRPDMTQSSNQSKSIVTNRSKKASSRLNLGTFLEGSIKDKVKKYVD